MNRFRKFCALERNEKLLFCESFLFHLYVGLLLKVVPFRQIPSLFRNRSRPPSGPQIPDQPAGVPGRQPETPAKTKSRTRSVGAEDHSRYPVTEQQVKMIEKIRVAVQRTGWVSPWRNRCLVSSLAARCMLRRRKIGSELSLGVAKDPKGKLLAHAWLKSGDFEIVEKRGSYTELFLF